jgi:integrase
MKIQLEKGCSHSQLSVSPKNWQAKKADFKQQWFISYRFYDPNYPKPKQVIIKGMNSFKSLVEKQLETKKLIENEIISLKNGFNPFANKTIFLNEQLTLIQALERAFNSLTVSDLTKRDLQTTINLFKKSIIDLGWSNVLISEISRKHLRVLLDESSNTADRFNKNRSYLMILISVLCELELVSTNYIRDIKKKKVTKHIREVLTDEQRVTVNIHLQDNYPNFHRFMHIFFHSGARISELLSLKINQIELNKSRYKILIKKGGSYKEVWKTIKHIALPFWTQIVLLGEPEDFLFSKNLLPGKVEIRAFQISKRWLRLVKKPLNITADFYSLKHLHTTEVVEMLGNKEAAVHNSHIGTNMVNQVYDIRRQSRKEHGVANLDNKFA